MTGWARQEPGEHEFTLLPARSQVYRAAATPALVTAPVGELDARAGQPGPRAEDVRVGRDGRRVDAVGPKEGRRRHIDRAVPLSTVPARVLQSDRRLVELDDVRPADRGGDGVDRGQLRREARHRPRILLFTVRPEGGAGGRAVDVDRVRRHVGADIVEDVGESGHRNGTDDHRDHDAQADGREGRAGAGPVARHVAQRQADGDGRSAADPGEQGQEERGDEDDPHDQGDEPGDQPDHSPAVRPMRPRWRRRRIPRRVR